LINFLNVLLIGKILKHFLVQNIYLAANNENISVENDTSFYFVFQKQSCV